MRAPRLRDVIAVTFMLQSTAAATYTSHQDDASATSTPLPSQAQAYTLSTPTPWLTPFVAASFAGGAFLDDLYDHTNTSSSANLPAHELDLRAEKAKRQACAQGYSPCRAQGFCCADNTVCQNDMNGQVACCPQGAACTGLVPSSTTAQTGGAAMTTTQPASNGASVGPNGGQVVAQGSTVAFIAGTGEAGNMVVGGFVGEMLGWLLQSF